MAVAMISSKVAFIPKSLSSPSGRRSEFVPSDGPPEVVVAGTIGDRRMAKRQCGRGQDVGWWSRLTLPSQDVEHDIGGMDAVAKRFNTSRFHSRQPIGQYRVEDVDHLAIAILSAGQLAPHALHRSRQHPVLEGGAIAQGAGLARQHRHVMPGIVNRLAAAK